MPWPLQKNLLGLVAQPGQKHLGLLIWKRKEKEKDKGKKEKEKEEEKENKEEKGM